jgi:DNA-directed RNA polymerase subunit L
MATNDNMQEAVKMMVAVQDPTSDKIEEWLKLKQSMDKANADLQAKMKELQDEFTKQFGADAQKLGSLDSEVLNIIKAVPNQMVEVDGLIIEYKKTAGKTTHSYKSLFEAALAKVNEEIKKELLDIQEATKNVGTPSEKLVIKAATESISTALKAAVAKISALYKNIVSKLKRSFSRTESAITSLKAVSKKAKSMKESLDREFILNGGNPRDLQEFQMKPRSTIDDEPKAKEAPEEEPDCPKCKHTKLGQKCAGCGKKHK